MQEPPQLFPRSQELERKLPGMPQDPTAPQLCLYQVKKCRCGAGLPRILHIAGWVGSQALPRLWSPAPISCLPQPCGARTPEGLFRMLSIWAN